MDDTLSVACDSREKSRWRGLAARMGYPEGQFSEFVRSLLNAAVDKLDQDEWEQRLLYLDQDRVVQPGTDALGVVAFPVMAPGRFWRCLERVQAGDDSAD